MNAAAYIRVSSRGQHLEMQRHAIDRAAALRGDVVAELYEEKRTASVLARPELDRLRAAVRAGAVRRLYVFRIDRLTRTGIRDTFELVEELRQHGCELVTASDGFDLNGPMAEPLIAMMAWAAKMENHARRERQAAARERIEEQGGTWGRPQRLTPAQQAEVSNRRRKRQSIRKIASALKIPHATIGREVARTEGASKHCLKK